VELRHIRYFIAVADSLNFSKAAQRLHISQPPLSRQIHQLEEELGVGLFVRNNRRVELTRAGRVFLDEARKLVVQAERATEAARHAQKGASGVLRIGMGAGLGRVICNVVVEHHKLFPTIDIECKDFFSSLQNEALSKREIDVGFLRPPVDHANLNCVALFEEKFVVIMPKTHRLAKRESVRLADIADEPLIIFDRNHSCGLYDRILGLYTSRGLTPRLTMTRVEAHEEAGAIAVASGKGIFIGAGAILKVNNATYGKELAILEMNEPDAKIEVYMAWRKDERDPDVFAFLDSVRRVFRHPARKQIA
jgi:DNA-binding transcriptional LysR family regulator